MNSEKREQLEVALMQHFYSVEWLSAKTDTPFPFQYSNFSPSLDSLFTKTKIYQIWNTLFSVGDIIFIATSVTSNHVKNETE